MAGKCMVSEQLRILVIAVDRVHGVAKTHIYNTPSHQRRLTPKIDSKKQIWVGYGERKYKRSESNDMGRRKDCDNCKNSFKQDHNINLG